MIRAAIDICAVLAGRRTDDWNVFGLPRARSPHHSARSRCHNHRDSVCLGAFQACRHFALAGRERSNKHRRDAAQRRHGEHPKRRLPSPVDGEGGRAMPTARGGEAAIVEAAKRGRTATALAAIEGQRKARAALASERTAPAERASLAEQSRRIETEAAPTGTLPGARRRRYGQRAGDPVAHLPHGAHLRPACDRPNGCGFGTAINQHLKTGLVRSTFNSAMLTRSRVAMQAAGYKAHWHFAIPSEPIVSARSGPRFDLMTRPGKAAR
jgi:hypothetical protein